MKKNTFSLDSKSGVPYYRQIIQQIEWSIAAGNLDAGDKLPTVRSLAIELKVNPNTVARAYSELEILGVVNTQVGSGTFISEKQIDMSDIERKKKLDELTVDFLNKVQNLGFSREEIIENLSLVKE